MSIHCLSLYKTYRSGLRMGLCSPDFGHVAADRTNGSSSSEDVCGTVMKSPPSSGSTIFRVSADDVHTPPTKFLHTPGVSALSVDGFTVLHANWLLQREEELRCRRILQPDDRILPKCVSCARVFFAQPTHPAKNCLLPTTADVTLGVFTHCMTDNAEYQQLKRKRPLPASSYLTVAVKFRCTFEKLLSMCDRCQLTIQRYLPD